GRPGGLGWPGRAARRRDLSAYGETVAPLYAEAGRVAGAPLVIDSSKDPSYLFALRATGRVDLAVVHLVRDSRAVAHSWSRRKLRPEVHWEERWMRTLSPSRSARRWIEINAMVELYRSVFRGSVLRLRYEDFARDAAGGLAEIVAAFGLAMPVEPRREAHSFSGNPSRFDQGPLRVTEDRSWTHQMSRRDRRAVTALTVPLLRKYGYPLW
ncbi:MAG: sulfotransferase, partial [Nocardioides sp.]|uniref:sulfotransferase n=1 Tax=Nocardioides sp. TaxID=35761 RepID=UPI0039E2DC40